MNGGFVCGTCRELQIGQMSLHHFPTDRPSCRAATSNGSVLCDANHTEYSSSVMPRNFDSGRCSLSSDSCHASMKSSICSAVTFPVL